MKLKQFIFALVAMLSSFAFTANAQVAKVGDTEYKTIDEAISNWTNGSTLTLLADVTLSDVIQLSSTEYHILDLGTYTMTAASRKDAIQIVNNGRSSASYALDIKADAKNPGGITASGKAVVKTTGKSGVKDRPIIRFYNGVFTGTNVIYHSGSNGTNCPQFQFYGGVFNGTVFANRALIQFYGGTFNGAIQISVDSSAYALVSGGRFKKLSNQYGSALNSDKFTIGSSKGNYNRGIYVDAEGYYVVTSEVIKEVSAKYPAVKKESYNSNNYFYYSAAAANGMFYEVASMAGTGSNVTVWEGAKVVEELKGNEALEYTPELPAEVQEFEVELTDVVLDENTSAPAKVVFTVTPSNANGEKVSNPASPITFRIPVPAAWAGKQVYVSHNGARLDGKYTVQQGNYVEVTSASFSEFAVEPVPPVAKIGNVEYTTLIAAIAAVQDGETITLIANEIFTATNYSDNGGWKDGVAYSGDKSFTIDLNGFTVSQDGSLNDYLFWFKNVGSKDNTITIKNGTLDAGNTAYCALCTASSHDNKLTVNTEDVNLINNISNGSTVKIRAGSVYNAKSGTKITGKNSYLGIENWKAEVNIYEGAEIYMNGTSSYNGCLVGVGGNGTVNVYGGYGKGVKGGFIAMTSGGTINVAGGEWIANTDGTVGNNSNLYVLTAQSNKYESGFAGPSIINVTGGTLRGGMDAWVLNNLEGEKAELNISGGNFNANPARYVEEGYLATVADGIYTVDKAAAKVGDVYYASLNEAFAAAIEGETVVLLNDATPALTSQRAITKAAVIDLGGKTLTLTEDDLYFGTTTFKNGTIVVDSSVRPSTAVFWMFANQTLTFDNVKIVATGVTGTYLIGLDGNNSDLNIINGSEIVVENTTALDLDIICVNASTGNDILVDNSKVNVTNLDGRVFFRGNYTVKDSEVNLAGITKAGFRIEAGQTLSIEGTSKVNIEGEPRDGGIHMTDLSATYTKAETATVNATVNEPKVAKVGENTYRTLAQAVAAVEDGGTITLIANETFTKNNRYNNGGWWDGLGYSGDKSFTIDLGGFTVSQDGSLNDYLFWFKNVGSKENTITIKNGTLDAGTTAFCALCTASSHDNKLTVNTENVNLINNISNGSTVKIRTGSVYNAKTGTKITGKNSYLGIENWNATVNIYDGAEIYMNGTSSYNGCLVGVGGNGTVNVYGGYGKGVSGGLIAMTSGGTINVEGGEWIANTDGTFANSNKSVLIAQSDKQYNAGAGNAVVNVTGGTFKGGYNCYGNAVGDAQINIKGGNFNSNPTNYVAEDYIAVENNGVWNVVKAAAKIDGVAYASLEAAFKAATEGCEIVILDNVTVDYNWDARNTGSKFTVPVTINGNGKTIKFTASVNDNNYQAPFRFEADATVKDLTIDMSEVTDSRFRAISSKGNLIVDGCTFIGKDATLNCRAIIFGEGAGANVGNLAIAVTNSEFINWKRGISDNENGQDVKTATITGNTLENAAVYVSAYENVTFTGNTVEGAYVDIRSYTANSSLNVTATGNTLEENTDTAYNYIKATGNIDQEGFKVYAVAKIGDVEYTTIEKAYAALQEGDEIVILKKGSYALKVKNNVTITGAVAGVEFANIGAFGCNGANVTFNNVTFTYDENSTYKGLQHSGNLVYNNCTFNGQVFLYGQSETFNKCTFNTTDSANYNVWTYGAKNVAFNECTFNCAGKSVLIYHENATMFNDVAVTNSTFNASQAVDGKAAIEMDASLTAGINLTIDAATTATGFGTGNVSGNSLWNNKKGNNDVANNDITVKVGDTVVLAPIFEAQIGDAQYRFFQDAINAVQNGETITVLRDIATNVEIKEKDNVKVTIDGNGKTMTGTIKVVALSSDNDRRITIKNFKFEDTTSAAVDFITSVETNHYPRITVEGCTFTGSGDATDVALRLKSSKNVEIKNCTGTGLHSFLQNTSGWNLTIENVTVTESKSAFALGTVQGVTVKGCTVDVPGYGIRMDAGYNNNAVIESNTIEAFIPVVVRKATVNSNIAVNGTNNLTVTNEDGLWMAIGTSEYEANGTMPTAATGNVVVALNDAALDSKGIYGNALAGQGTAEAPYLINNIGELVLFRNSVNAGETKYSAPGVHIALGADIDMTGINWVGIGSATAEHGFMGNFDGQGFKIKNLTITNPALDGDGYAYAGLFGVTEGTDKDNQNYIKNLVIENVTINTTGHIAAAAIAYPYYTIVDNVKVCGDIKIQGGDYTAGVLAYTRRCVNASNLSIIGENNSFVKGAQVVGGVISDIQMNGGLKANYSNFSAEGVTVSGTKNVGGISGIIATQTLNGATVKNVELISGNAGVGIVAGCLGGTSTISNVTYENVAGASTLLGNTYDGTAIEARIDETYYATLEAALAAEGNEVELLAPVTVATGESRVIELNGKTVIGTDNATGSFALININPEAELTINGEGGAIKLTATNNRGWNAYSSVISNQRGKLTVNGGTIEHLGGTDMAYAIDNLTNTGAQNAETVINGGTVKSTYRAIRQFLNSTSAQNVLTVNGGTIEGANKSIWMQGANANANPGALTVEAAAAIKGDVYLTTAAGTAEYPVVVAVAADALKDGAQVLTSNVPAEYTLANVDGVWSNVAAAAAINGKGYATFAAAVEAAQKGATIVLLQDVNVGSITIEKSLTIDGAGKTITGHIHANLGNTKMTVKNVNFNGDNATYDYAIRVDRASSFVAENCTADGYKYSFLYANKSNNNFTIKDVTVTNCANYGVYFASFNNATIENLTVIGAEYGVAAGNAANSKVNIKNSTFDVELPLYIQDKGTGKVTFTFEGVNNMGDEIVYLSEYVKLASAVQVGTTVYGTFAEAFAAAQDGETVKLLSDFNLGLNDVVVNNAGQKVLANVDGKNITFDMNGKKITVDHRSTEAADRIYSVICVEDGAGLTVKGNGSIDVTTGVTDANVMPKVAYMFWKRGTTGYLVIEDGNYHMDNSEDSMVYTNGGNIVTVKGGTFTLDAVGTRLNGFPWVFNVAGNDAASLNVTGGTYNYDIRTQFWSQEVKLAEGLTMTNNADGTWTVVPAVASIVDGESYGSIQEAIDAAQDGETVKLLADVAYADADALSVEEKPYSTMLYVQGKNITLDLNGKNIDVEYTGSLLYSVVLVSDGAGLTVTGEGSINVRGLKADGTAAKNIAYVFWKRGTTGYLVIENGTFRMNDAADSMVYTNGDEIVTINGGTFILDAVASQTNGFPVIFSTQGNNEKQIVVNGGTFNYNINYQMRPFEVSIAPQKALKKVQVDGVDMWTIVAAQAYVTEKLGDFVTDENGSYEHNVGYETIAEAFAAVKNGETVTIFAGEFTQNLTVNKGITVQGEVDENGNNLVTFNGKLSITADGATVENLNFNNSGTAAYVGAENVTIDGCSLVGSNGLYQSYTSGTVTFKNSYIKGGTYGIHFDGNAGGNIVIENCTVIGWTSFAAAINSVAISGTTFAEGNYNQLRLYQNAQFTDCTFNEKMNIDWGSSNKNAEFTNCSVEGDKDLTEIISLANIANKALEVTIDGERVCVAAKVDNKYYLALQAAIDAATEGQTVTILSDIALTEGVTVAADDNIFIDLNGKTVSMETAEAAVAALIKNNGTLTINSSVDGGKLSFLATAPSAANAYASNTISNYGTLTINAGTVENLSTGGACYALDNYAGSTATIIGGKLTAEKTAVRVFNWTNGEANAAELNVEGGEIISNDGYGININAGNAPYVALNISGGTITTNDTDYNLAVYVVNKNSAENFTANIEGGIFNGNLALNGVTSTTMAKGNVSVSGGTFDGVICYGEPACQFITGGSYKTEFTEDYLVYGYQLEANTETALYDANWTGRREVVTIVDGEVTEFDNEKDIEVGTLTYKRRFAAVNVWQPLYLPFEIPVSKLIELGYDVAYTNDVHLDDNEFDGVIDRIWVEYVGLKSGNLKAHFPYVVRATSPAALDLNLVFNDAMLRSTSENQIVLECSSAFYEFEFGGTYNIVNRNDLRENEETSCFALVVSSGNWAEFINDALTLNPFRVYMTMTAKAGSPVTISESAMKNIGSRLVGELNEDGTTTIYEVNAENGEEMIFDLSGRRVLETEKGIYIKDGKKIYVK